MPPPGWYEGNFAQRTGTGLQSWGAGSGEGIPFLPQALILWYSGADEYDDVLRNPDQRYGLRFGVGLSGTPGDSWTAATVMAENSSDEYGYTFSRALAILSYSIFGGGVVAKCDLHSYDTITPGVKYGFTLDWLVNSDTLNRKINFVAIGGLEAVNVIRTGGLSQSGSRVVSGVGFCPDLMVFVGNTNSVDEGTGNGGQLFFGVANHALQQWSVAIGGASGSDTNKARCQSTTHCILLPSADTSSPRFAAAVSVVDEDGFTLAQSGDEGASGFETGGCEAGVLCLKGIGSSIGSFNKATAEGVQTVSTDVTPIGVMLASFQRTATADSVPHARIGIGAADVYGNQGCMAAQSTDAIAVATSHSDCFASNAAIFAKYDNNSETIEALAGLSSVSASAFALGWSPCDAVASQILFLAVGASSFGRCEAPAEEEEPPVFQCVEDLTDADLIAFRYDAGDAGIVNQVIARFDHDAETDQFTKMLIFEDNNSIRRYGPRPPIIIESKGLRTALGAEDFLRARAREIFGRFGIPPDVLQVETFYRKHALEAGDIVCVSSAFIPNLEISGRGVAEKPYEVVDCRPQFFDRGRLTMTLLACRAITGVPLPPTDPTDPDAPGPEEAVTTLGLMGAGRGVWEIA